MSDKTRDTNNFQKRGVSVFTAPLVEADVLLTGSVYGTLPPRSVIKSVSILVTTVSTTATADLAVDFNGAALEAAILVTGLGDIIGVPIATAAYSATGGDIVVKAGATTPAAGDFVGELVIEYIELDKKSGEYTTMTNS
jgi:hypothetical protein